MVNLWFMFSLIWSIGASVDEPGRKALDTYLREQEGSFPNKDSIYEYFLTSSMEHGSTLKINLKRAGVILQMRPSIRSSYQQSIVFDTIHLFRLF